MRLDLANSLAALGRWSEVADQLEQAIEDPAAEIPEDSFQRVSRRGGMYLPNPKVFRTVVARYGQGLACLMAGDRDTYERCCEQLLDESSEIEAMQPYTAILCLHLLVPR